MGHGAGTAKWRRLTADMNARNLMRHTSIAADLIAMLIASSTALAVRSLLIPALGLAVTPAALDWERVVPFVAMLVAFAAAGLYERDAYSSRPLHAWTVLQATTYAFVVSAATAFLVGSAWLVVPRVTLVLTFAIFLIVDMPLRLVGLHQLYATWVDARRPHAFVVGDSPGSRRLTERLGVLRGFERVQMIEDVAPSGLWSDALAWELDHRGMELVGADSVFVDTGSLSPRETMCLIEWSRERGIDTYVVSGLLGPLEGSGLLKALFQTPVTRVRGTLSSRTEYMFNRGLDILGALFALALLSPAIAVIALVVRVTSPGPVFLTQTRMGRNGSTFGFLKFRSMYVDSDSSSHQKYVHAMISGEAMPTVDASGADVFHIVDDPRATPVGRFIRKYSLDEIPQFVNVLKGEMSLVGPRPPLPYEAEAYDEWQRQRLEVQSGVTGVWQVVGRNRVSFDEMTFQDLMYGMNKNLWVDLRLCFWTIPAALIGGGI